MEWLALGHLQSVMVRLFASAPAENDGRESFVLISQYSSIQKPRTQKDQVPRLHCMNLGSEVQYRYDEHAYTAILP